MKKRFVICINDATKAQEEAFISFIRDHNLSWWHWLSNLWLLSDKEGKLTAAQIRDELKTIFYNKQNLVLEITNEKDTWAGFGPNTDERNMFTWLKKNWKK